jgi:predicted phosphodiesterase
MKLGIIGDTHYTNRGPSKRRDDFFKTQLAKTFEALTIFRKNGCDYILQSGDLFDSHSVANRVKAAIITLLMQKFDHLYCVAGQHDIVGHSLGTLPNSPLSVLEAAGVISLMDENPCALKMNTGFEAYLYGSSFGTEIPIPINPKTYNILIIHAMIGDRLLYPGQNLTSPQKFLKNYPDYNLVVAGDYHYSFQDTYKDRTIVNAGCLVRKTVSTFDLEHKPSVVIFDTETKKLVFHPLTITPSEEIFDLTKTTILDTLDTDKFIRDLKKRVDGPRKGESWRTYLPKIFKKRKSSKKVKLLIDQCMEEVKNG